MPKDAAIRVEGLRDLQRALRKVPPGLKRELKDASREIAVTASRQIQAAARTRAERRTAGSIRSRAGLEAVIAAGGGPRTPGGPMFFGTEFGGRGRSTTMQFREHTGTRGYFFYPTVRRRGEKWADLWLRAIDATLYKEWKNL